MRNDQSLVARSAAGAGAALTAALLAAGLTAGAATADAGLPAQARQVAERMNRLGAKTLGQLVGKRNDATVVVSPYGLGSVLHLLMMGAASASPAETSLQKSLLPASVTVGRQDAPLALIKERILASSSDKLTLALASAVFVPRSAEHSDTFQRRADAVFKAPIEALDFKSASALERINGWAKDATQGRVPRIVDELDRDARFVLTNAVYFKGAWETAFDPARTVKAPFTRADGSKRDVAMMDASLPVELSELDGLRAVWLPYHGRDVAMLVVAPGPGGAPTIVADTLRAKPLDALVAAAQSRARKGIVQVRLPRFRAESSLDITAALSSQIAPALAADSDYDAINKGKTGPLQVVHRAVLEIAEAGTVAAAATAVTSNRSLAVTPVFSADRPFLLAIVHRPMQAILFAGYVADPGDAPAAKSTH